MIKKLFYTLVGISLLAVTMTIFAALVIGIINAPDVVQIIFIGTSVSVITCAMIQSAYEVGKEVLEKDENA